MKFAFILRFGHTESRAKIQKEADFYGAMDGATKIVKGDAIMSIIITLINFVGGVLVGIVMNGGAFGDVLQTYTIATIGDGLVSQLPSLLISTATGMIVTRSCRFLRRGRLQLWQYPA